MLGHYKIEAQLGAGGMGVVYRAYDTRLERAVAVKLMNELFRSDDTGTARVFREARSASALNHPNICTVHEVGEAEEHLYIVMEFIEGKPLNKLIPAGGMPLEAVTRYGLQIADAVAHAHDRGIIHRDLKTQNVVITNEGRVKVLDFGLAKRIHDDTKGHEEEPTQAVNTLTQAGAIAGTLHYIAPETLLGNPAAVTSDVWALGVVLYEMAAGTLPFQGRTSYELTSAIINAAVAPLPASVSSSLRFIIQRCLEKEPALRYQQAREVRSAIEALQSGSLIAPQRQKAESKDKSVAVIDFVNITGDPSVEWLSGGIAETVTVDLKKLASLRVTSRDRVLKALGASAGRQIADDEAARIGQTTGSRWLVSGGYQKAGNAIRITARFIESATGEMLGSAKIDGTMDDIFKMQDEIIKHLIEALHLDLATSEIHKIEKPETDQLPAYEAYVRGRRLFVLFGKSSFEDAQKLFEQAIELDPKYALAYSGLGSIYAFKFIAHTDPRDLDIAISHLQKARDLDPDLADPYQWLAYAYMRKSKYEEAIRSGLEGIRLDPQNGTTHYFLATAYHLQADMEAKLASYGEAIRFYKKASLLQPNFETPYLNLACIYMNHGLYQEADPLFEKAMAIEDSEKYEGVKFLGAFMCMGTMRMRQHQLESGFEYHVHSLKKLNEMDHVYREAFMSLSECCLADIHAERGEYEKAEERYQKGRNLIERFPKGLGMGYYLVRILLGIARMLIRQSKPDDARNYFRQAKDLFEKKETYDFHWIWEGNDAQAHFQFGVYHVMAGDKDEALMSLQRAAKSGWGDPLLLQSSQEFLPIRNTPAFREVVQQAEAASRQVASFARS